MTRIGDAVTESLSWLWPGYIPQGKLTLLDGDPQLGKSLITIDLAARLSSGREMPDGVGGGSPQRTLFLQAEDRTSDTVKPRLAAAGANFDWVYELGHEGRRPIRLPRHVRAIENLIRINRISLLVIDPLIAFLPPQAIVSSDVSIRGVLRPLAAMAERTNVAVLLVRHLNKREGQKALYRGGGSIGMIGSVRAGLLVAPDPTDAGRRLLMPLKSNLGPTPPAQAYRIVGNAERLPIIEWLGKSDVTPDEALARYRPESTEPGMFLAADWLVKKLMDGPKLASKVIEEALAAGFSEHTLYRAKKEAHVESELKYTGKSREWIWKLYKPLLPPMEELW
jgi:hypothetical protein